MATTGATVGVADLRRFVIAVLETRGVPGHDGAAVADALLYADARAISSHGLALFPGYLRRLAAGTIAARCAPLVVEEFAAIAVLDGDNGLGPVAARRAMLLAIDKAAEFGLGAVAVRNGNHFGPAGYYASLALERRMLGVATSNAAAIMAPPGGATPVVGNNPVAIAAPAADAEPVIVDLALSVASVNKIRQVAARGERLPAGWALDRTGRPTDDPQVALDGLLMPAGGHKGFGLAVATELLASVLPGGLFAWDVLSREHHGMGFFFLALDVDRFLPDGSFGARAAELARRVAAAERLPGIERMSAPGIRAAQAARESMANGIPCARLPWAPLESIASDSGVPLPSPHEPDPRRNS
jgi:LDH2 family malate/lactate/ureidoglycolate dehydrogenase